MVTRTGGRLPAPSFSMISSGISMPVAVLPACKIVVWNLTGPPLAVAGSFFGVLVVCFIVCGFCHCDERRGGSRTKRTANGREEKISRKDAKGRRKTGIAAKRHKKHNKEDGNTSRKDAKGGRRTDYSQKITKASTAGLSSPNVLISAARRQRSGPILGSSFQRSE